ncbi:MAG: adenine phosphoribosyltransferase, partial [Bacteroidales bacterium]|nr:adenine phosphoribosyltransferase [Bacteroidales bacterium]
MTDQELIKSIRVVPDFPVKGIQFFDVTTLFKNPETFNEVLDRIAAIYKDKGITKVAGIESRGFIAGAAVAARLGAGFVPVRKPGKLPAQTVSESYAKEYG